MSAHELEEALYRSTVEHEAAHAAAAVLLGLEVKRIEAMQTKIADFELGKVLGGTWIAPAVGEAETRARATVTLVGQMCEQGDDGSQWPPSFDELMTATDGETHDTTELRGYVKAMGLGRRGYELMVLDALKLACSGEFVTLHRRLDHALRENDGYLDEKDIAAIREKARKPKPPPPEDVERDELGVISDAAADQIIDELRAARAIAGNGDGPEIAETKAEAFAFARKAFEAGRVTVATFEA